jgi:hypothetical protein
MVHVWSIGNYMSKEKNGVRKSLQSIRKKYKEMKPQAYVVEEH